jgi:hypothetical protein
MLTLKLVYIAEEDLERISYYSNCSECVPMPVRPDYLSLYYLASNSMGTLKNSCKALTKTLDPI